MSVLHEATSDPDTSRFVEVNERWCETTGYSREALVGRSALDLGMWDDPDVREAA